MLNVTGNALVGAWHIALDDLERSTSLDINGDGQLIWDELLQSEALISSIAKTYLNVFQQGESCRLSTDDIMLDNLSSGLYLYLPLVISCAENIDTVKIHYNYLFDIDAQHKAVISLKYKDATQSFVFSDDARERVVEIYSGNKLQTLKDFIWQGVWHIWIGIDHILFLLCLLLPSALILRHGRWEENISSRQALISTIKIITAFTLAHSITLCFSVIGWITLSSRLVESVIAASVIVAALNNLKPLFHQRLWLLTFVFGLVHGMGFASVLNDIGLPVGEEALALIGFNLGVELGQLAIVGGVSPLIFYVSRSIFYRRGIMQLSSVSISVIAMLWFLERSVEIEFIKWI